MKRIAAFALFVGLGFIASAHAQIPDFTPQTPLIGALLHHDISEATRLLRQGADPNEGTFFGFPPVILAVQRHDVDLLRMMVAKGADLSARDSSGSTVLMWAAANESGDAAMADELLRMGADPRVVNKVGESALDWALRRGDTPVAAALRRAGASDAPRVKASVEKALAPLQRSGAQFGKVSGCYSCHHVALPQMAFGIARTRGMTFDESAAHEQARAALAPLTSVLHEALRNRDRIPDPPIGLSYALVSLAAVNYPADEMTRDMTLVIAAWQGDDGAFHTLPEIRTPLESDDVTATALSLRALQLYGTDTEGPVARARDWLRRALPRSTEERAMQLLGLTWAKAPADDIRRSTTELLALQRQDGGWAQLPGLETDAYATGQALVAMHTAGVANTSPEYRRGTAFLMRTQFQDGSWLVRTRTFPAAAQGHRLPARQASVDFCGRYELGGNGADALAATRGDLGALRPTSWPRRVVSQ